MVDSAAVLYTYEAYLDANGVRVPFEPAIITPAIRNAIANGKFETSEAAQIPRIVRSGDRVLEIGAGIGVISTLLAWQRRVRRVIAVEANPMLMGYMERLHELNGVQKVRRINAVLTNSPIDTMTFYMRRDFWQGSLIPEPNPYEATVEVPTLSFDRLVHDEGISLIVCDIEGAESLLFEDVDFGRVDRVFVEVHDHITGLSGVGRLFAAMARHGFVYDPRHSVGSVILFQKVGAVDIVRPFSG